MLIIARKAGESFFISDEEKSFCIEVKITDVSGKTVKVGIDAPEQIKIRRDCRPSNDSENTDEWFKCANSTKTLD
jgi:carbon storage regulator CsrA